MNTLSFIPDFVSVSDLQRSYPTILKTLKAGQKPLLVLKKNELEAVILTPLFYQTMMDKVQEYEEKDALLALANYTKAKKERKLIKMKTTEELFE
jgi:PHD/YefM family antitoxin component YafN of YafNO toxin-antitoxin module